MLKILDHNGRIVEPGLLSSLGLSAQDCLRMYRDMIRVRALHHEGERRAHWNHMTLFIGPWGQEAAEVAGAHALKKENWAYVYGRTLGVPIARGVNPRSIFDYFFGNPGKILKDFHEHSTHLPYVAVGIQMPHAVGHAWAEKIIAARNVPIIAYFGDGATAEPFFHSGMNWASVFGLPVIFFCENNQWAISTRTRLQTATKTFADRALGYGMESCFVDGNDPFAVLLATRQALERAYKEGKPTLIEAYTYRLGDHTTAVSQICHISEEEKILAKEQDPLKRFQRFLLSKEAEEFFKINWNEMPRELLGMDHPSKPDGDQQAAYYRMGVEPGLADSIFYFAAYREIKEAAGEAYEEFHKNRAKGKEIINEAVTLMRAPKVATRYLELSGVKAKPFRRVSAFDAFRAALYDLMRFDQSVVYIGQDVGEAGGVLRTTALRGDLAEEERFIREKIPDYKERILKQYLPLKNLFPERIIDTPLDEAGIIGTGLGLALSQKARPGMEMQFSGFSWIGREQIEEYSRMFFRNGGRLAVPGVIVLPFGGGDRIEYHHDSEIPNFLGNPGLIVACPSAVQDFYDLTWAAFSSDKPVLLFLHINLQREPKLDELLRRPAGRPIEEFGIRVAREGNDVTIASCGALVYECLKAAELAAKKKVSVEVLDLRVMNPLDTETLLNSITKTGRLIVVQEEQVFPGNDNGLEATGGVGAFVLSAVATSLKGLQYVRSPRLRIVGAPWTHPLGGAKFWDYFTPQTEDITKAIIDTTKN